MAIDCEAGRIVHDAVRSLSKRKQKREFGVCAALKVTAPGVDLCENTCVRGGSTVGTKAITRNCRTIWN
eukprot:4865189-Amphidinium_carterae.1